MTGGPSIPQVLVESIRARTRGPRETPTLELAVHAAAATDLEERAWMLVALAARLRREHDVDLARLAIERALALDAGERPTRAAYTCAVSLHADDGDLETAVRIGEELLAQGADSYLLNTMARVYWKMWRRTKDEAWYDSWWDVHVQLSEISATAAA